MMGNHSSGTKTGGRKYDKGKKPLAGTGGPEKSKARVADAKGEPSSSSSSKAHPAAHIVPVFCDVCGDPRPLSDICFDAVACSHLFCFDCVGLHARGHGDVIVSCPVPGCETGFLHEQGPLTYFCKICMEKKSPDDCFLDVSGCDHVFCTECIAAYLTAKVEENAVAAIPCPEPDCANGRLEPNACRPVIPPSLFERWGVALCEAAVVEGSRFYCPYPDCSTLMVKEEDAVGKQALVTYATCWHCGRRCCAQCRTPWHAGLTCEERRRSEAEKEGETKVMDLAKEKHWQRCPKCGFLVERVDGCVFIRCRCRHSFCYRCASTMDPMDAKHFCSMCQLTWDPRN